MKYIDSDFPFAALLRLIDSYFAKSGPAVLRKECELLIKPPTALIALRSLHYVADCFPAHLQLKAGKIIHLQPLSTANLAPILTHESLFAFDLCVGTGVGSCSTPVDSIVRRMSRHPAYTLDLTASLETKSFHPTLFSYSEAFDGSLRMKAKSQSPPVDQVLGEKLCKLLHSLDLKPAPLMAVEASTPTDKTVLTASPAPSPAQPKQAPATSTVAPKTTSPGKKPEPAAASTTKPLSKSATASPIPTPCPSAPTAIPASAISMLPKDGLLTTTDRNTIYLIRSLPVADTLADAIISLNPTRLAFASTGDFTKHVLNDAIDVIQVAITDPAMAANKGGQHQSVVFLWDLARATSNEDRTRMIQSLGRVLTSVTALGGKIVVHDAQMLGTSIVGQAWFDLGAVVETKFVKSEWCNLAHEAQGMVAVMEQQAKGPHGHLLSPTLIMSAAKRARLIAPVAQQHSSVRATSEDELCLNDMLKSCALPVNNLHATVESLVRKHLADFHELMLNHAISEADANNGWFIDPATASTTTNPLDTNSGFGAAATTPSPPSFVRKRYWDLGPDKLMLARAAAQQVDQLLPALDVLESNVSALTDWKRRANAYFAATQYMVHDQWSLSPRLPKHIAVQARFTNDGRLIWRYGGSEHEDMPATPDLGLVGASDGLQRVHDQFVHRTEQEVRDLLNLLPYRVREAIDEIPDAVHSLNEVVLDLGEPPRLRFFALNQAALDLKDVGRVTQEDIDAIVDGRKFSSDRRGGINGQLHRISWVANREGKAIGLTIRVGRACPPGEGVTQMLLDLVKRGESVLFLGKPGSGKTHTLRDFVARLSDTGNNVMIVDTSNEVGGPGDVKHFSLHKARRLQVRDRSRQFEVLLEAVQNHTPDIVCIDEISDSKEVAAARSVATRVKGTVATAHGDLESILRNKVMRELLGGLQTATVGDARAKELGGRKTVTTRAEESLFTTVVELVSRTEVRVFQNVGHVVDAILHPHGFPWAERRWLATPDGSVSGTSAGGHKFFLVQVEPLEKPDLEGP